jgi:hypothetical protein
MTYDELVGLLRSWCGKRVTYTSLDEPDTTVTGVMFEDEWPPGVRFFVPLEPPHPTLGGGRGVDFSAESLIRAELGQNTVALRAGHSLDPTRVYDAVLALVGPGWMPTA